MKLLAILPWAGAGAALAGVLTPWMYAGTFVAQTGLASPGGRIVLALAAATALWAGVLLLRPKERNRLFGWYALIVAGFVVTALAYSSQMDLRVLIRALTSDDVTWRLGAGPLVSAVGGVAIAAVGFIGTTAVRWRRRQAALPDRAGCEERSAAGTPEPDARSAEE